MFVAAVTIDCLCEALEVLPRGYSETGRHEVQDVGHDHRARHAEAVGNLITRFLLHVSEEGTDPVSVHVAAHLLPDAHLNLVELKLALADTVASHLLLPHKPARVVDVNISFCAGLCERPEEVLSPTLVFATCRQSHLVRVILRIEQVVLVRVSNQGSGLGKVVDCNQSVGIERAKLRVGIDRTLDDKFEHALSSYCLETIVQSDDKRSRAARLLPVAVLNRLDELERQLLLSVLDDCSALLDLCLLRGHK